MLYDKRILTVVPARGGSKGVKLKNIQPILGIPLIGYTGKIITSIDFIDRSVVSTDNEEIAENARMLGDMAFIKEKRFFHPKIGFNYRMTNLQAAVGLAQLENIGKLIEIRRKNAQFYNSLLKDIEGLTLPPELNHVKNVYWMYSVLVTSKFKISRDNLMDKLAKYGIETRNFFIPMHKQPIFPHISGKYPVAENLSDSGINLPSGATLQKDEIRYIVNKILE